MQHVTGANVDYGSGPYKVSISAGNTNVTFDVKINDDSILEGNETFNLTINVSSLSGCINYAVPYQATVRIMDDDGKFIDKRFYLNILHHYILCGRIKETKNSFNAITMYVRMYLYIAKLKITMSFKYL